MSASPGLSTRGCTVSRRPGWAGAIWRSPWDVPGSHPPLTQLLSQPRLSRHPDRHSKQTTQTPATKLLPINPLLPITLWKKPFFFSIGQQWLQATTTQSPGTEPLAPAGTFVTVPQSWGSNGREGADGKSPFIGFELFLARPLLVFSPFLTFMAKNWI